MNYLRLLAALGVKVHPAPRHNHPYFADQRQHVEGVRTEAWTTTDLIMISS